MELTHIFTVLFLDDIFSETTGLRLKSISISVWSSAQALLTLALTSLDLRSNPKLKPDGEHPVVFDPSTGIESHQVCINIQYFGSMNNLQKTSES